MPPFSLMALDGADDDGGTLYVLLDDDQPVLAAGWPMPLEEYAARHGRDVRRVPSPLGGDRPADYGPDDWDDEREMLDDLMAAVAAVKAA